MGCISINLRKVEMRNVSLSVSFCLLFLFSHFYSSQTCTVGPSTSIYGLDCPIFQCLNGVRHYPLSVVRCPVSTLQGPSRL